MLKLFRIAAGGLCVLAVLGGPSALYTLVRLGVTVAGGLNAWAAWKEEQAGWAYVFGGIALLFNPLVPFYLGRDAWVVFDVITAGVFAVSLFAFDDGEVRDSSAKPTAPNPAQTGAHTLVEVVPGHEGEKTPPLLIDPALFRELGQTSLNDLYVEYSPHEVRALDEVEEEYSVLAVGLGGRTFGVTKGQSHRKGVVGRDLGIRIYARAYMHLRNAEKGPGGASATLPAYKPPKPDAQGVVRWV